MKNLIKGIGLVVVFIFMIAYFFGGGIENHTENELNKIELQVEKDAIRQYEIAKRSSSAMDAYVQAGLVSAAF